KRRIDLSISENEVINSIFINNDSSLWILLDNKLEYPNQITNSVKFIDKNGSEKVYNNINADNSKNSIEIERNNSISNNRKFIVLYSHNERDGFYIINSNDSQVKHARPN